MNPVIALFVGLGVAFFGVLFPTLCFAFLGDEMPGWMGEWAPFVSIVLALAGAITVLVSAILIVTGGA